MPKSTTATTKGTSSTKKTPASKSSARTTPNVDAPVVSPSSLESEMLAAILGRLEALEGKVAGSFATLVEELRSLKESLSAPSTSDGQTPPETALPLVADMLRKNLMEHLTPVTAALKRLEERVGFVANRLKQGGGGGQDRSKSWRHDQGRHQRPQRGQQSNQRANPPQPQQWTPPSAASVQGHFAPRPLPGGGFVEEED
jgi:hypothetical protein